MKRFLTALILTTTLTLAGCSNIDTTNLPVEFRPTCQQTPVGEVCPRGAGQTDPTQTEPEAP